VLTIDPTPITPDSKFTKAVSAESLSLKAEAGRQRDEPYNHSSNAYSTPGEPESSFVYAGHSQDSERSPHVASTRKRKRSIDSMEETDELLRPVENMLNSYKNHLQSFLDLTDMIFSSQDCVESGLPIEELGRDVQKLWSFSDENATLSTETLMHLIFLLSTMKKSSDFQKLPFDTLLRLERLCEVSLQHSALPSNFLEEICKSLTEASSSLVVENVMNVLANSHTLLLLMTGQHEDKTLLSESILSNVVVTTKDLINCLTDGNGLYDKVMETPSITRTTALTFSRVVPILELLEQILHHHQVSEYIINSVECLSMNLLFASSEDSPSSTARAMDSCKSLAIRLLTTVFARYDERENMLNEIFSNLQKLSVHRTNARQFMLRNNKSIQNVSALFMRLIQTQYDDMDKELESEKQKSYCFVSQIVGFYVSKAVSVPKTSSDSPFRNLFEMLVEDFTTCIDMSEWSSSELFLRTIIGSMIGIIDSTKASTLAVSMALDVLGVISSMMAPFVSASSNAGCEKGSDIATLLKAGPQTTLEIDVVANFFCNLIYIMRDQEDENAARFLLSLWLPVICPSDQDANQRSVVKERVANALRIDKGEQLIDNVALEDEEKLQIVECYADAVSCLPVFRLFDAILSRLFKCIDLAQVTTRSKGLRAIGGILDSSPKFLTRPSMMTPILSRFSDSSPQVRDAAVDLVGKYLRIDREVALRFYPAMSERLNDNSIAVRKRAVKYCKELYSMFTEEKVKVDIGSRLLLRIQDEEDSVIVGLTHEQANKESSQIFSR